MSILVGRDTRLMVQGITGREGSFHAMRCREYGANLVAGVTPGRGGQMFDGDVPVYDTVEQAIDETGADASLIFVPPPFAADAIVESVAAGIGVIACITEGISRHGHRECGQVSEGQVRHPDRSQLPGCHIPGRRLQNGHHARPHTHGRTHGRRIAQRHAHLRGRRDSSPRSASDSPTCVGIGGDPVNGSSFVDILKMFQDDPDTDGVVMIGEIGGSREQEAAEFIGGAEFTKPVAALIVGQSAPSGQAHGDTPEP